jgi:hypothetical protein
VSDRPLERDADSGAGGRAAPTPPEGAAPDEDMLLAALLQIPAEEAARVRDRTPSRVRPRRQQGPSADYGDADG